jgi:hypothetical protein
MCGVGDSEWASGVSAKGSYKSSLPAAKQSVISIYASFLSVNFIPSTGAPSTGASSGLLSKL